MNVRLIHKFLGVKFTIKDYVRTEEPQETGEITENSAEDSEEDLEKELASEDEGIFGGDSQHPEKKKEELDTDTEKPRWV